MATKSQNEKNERWTIQFQRNDGKRPSIRIGKVTDRVAERFRLRIEELESSHAMGHPIRPATSAWLNDISRKHHERIAATGLIESAKSTTLALLVDQFITTASVKDTTKKKYRSSAKHLLDFFGSDCDPRTITPGDTTDWHNWMLSGRERTLAKATAGKSVKHAKQFMAYAIDKRLLEVDPFAKLIGSCKPNRKRDYFVSLDEVDRVLAACPDAQWRLLFALARFGGLRTPSEPLALKWSDVNWETNRFLVHAKKTEHYEDGGLRWVPIFPELRPHLIEVFEQAQPGSAYIITRYRDSEANLGTQLRRIVERAGLVPWPKLWQNLRTTRQTELLDMGFGPQCVTKWIGNSIKIAMDHYLQVREEHYELAAIKSVRNAVQTVHAEPSPASPHFAKGNLQAVVSAGLDGGRQDWAISGNAVQNPNNGPGGT